MSATKAAEPLKIGILSSAHMHVWSYASALKHSPKARITGLWDSEVERGEDFAQKTGVPYVGYIDELLSAVDAVVIGSENNRHLELVAKAAKAGRPMICEKPLAARAEDADEMERVVSDSGVHLMTAFPCRFSPAYQRLKERVNGGEIGQVRAINATNRGRCPFGWFVDTELSGGGSMIDHVVHVTDLIRDLLKEEPFRVQAQTGNNMYGQSWEDTAMVTIDFPSGIFATIDSSWSRPQTFKTWGDVTMLVTGDDGVIEMDMFGVGLDVYDSGPITHTLAGYGTDLDALMIDEFIESCIQHRAPKVTMRDGLQAARVALAGYRSLGAGQPVLVK